MLGSWVPEPVAVCDIAVPLRLLSNAVDRIAITEGATEPDDNLMMVSPRAQDGLCRPDVWHDATQTSPSFRNWTTEACKYFRRAVDMSIRRMLTARLKRYDVCFWQILLQKSFWGGERKFLEPLMRFTRGDVRDRPRGGTSALCSSFTTEDLPMPE